MTKIDGHIPFTLIIAAAGNGTRFDKSRPKQYWECAGKTILRHTIERFSKIKGLQNIHVIINPEHESAYNESIAGIELSDFTSGGKTRKESINNALLSLSYLKNDDIVLIHDAARPFFKPDDIYLLLDKLKTNKAVSLCSNTPNTLLNATSNDYVDRTQIKSILTPQGFHYGTIMNAHNAHKDQDDFTDDTSLVLAMGEHVEFIDSFQHNFKITTKDDLHMAEALFKSAYTTRTGLGYDVHAFDSAPAEHVRLGGIDIEHDKRLKGHSDADVVLHTITDALLGAIAAGDIGDHFPPSNNDYKDMDSAIFLEKARDTIKQQGGNIINIDVTIMCEAPKITLHKESMRNRIAEILDVNASTVSIKATTTEKLGFTGRQEGIAAQAIANVNVPI